MFKNKYIKIFENNQFEIEIENMIGAQELKSRLNDFILEELKKEDSQIISMLIFLKKVTILSNPKILDSHIRVNEQYQGNIIYISKLFSFIPDGNLNLNIIGIRIMIKSANFIEMFKHELTHLYHLEKSYLLRYYYNKSKKLNKSIFSNFFLFEQRKDILDFFYSIIIEGFATYIQNLEKYDTYFKLLNENDYLALTQVLTKIKQELVKSQDCFEYISNLKLGKSTYLLGHHIIGTILYYSKISFFELIEMRFKQILELYEEIIFKETKYIPLITYSSNKGLIDYNQTLTEWRKLRKNEK